MRHNANAPKSKIAKSSDLTRPDGRKPDKNEVETSSSWQRCLTSRAQARGADDVLRDSGT
jgi:hypothetical protein